MTRRARLRIAGVHLAALREHLFPGDGNEAVAFGLCGRHAALDTDVLLVQEVHVVPYEDCPVRASDLVTWKTDVLEPLLAHAAKSKLGIVKFHSHPTGFEEFSQLDDQSDQELFDSIYGWIDDEGPHASVVLLPDGRLFGRAVDPRGHFLELDQVLVADHDIVLTVGKLDKSPPAHADTQLFGARTTNLLNGLSVGVVGCSGTGSFVIEMLARLGVGRLVLVDPDRVEYRNLNRILGTTAADAATKRLKVHVLGEHVAKLGLATVVELIPSELATTQAVRALAGCDVLFGCTDSHDGRRTLNRLACFYVLPYFDCGVGLKSDGAGGIEEVSVASHYIQPGRSTLLGRGAIRADRADAEAMVRRDPARYRSLHAEKYIEGVQVDNPAVISINALAASLMVNEFLARLHPFHLDANSDHASVRLNLAGTYLDSEPEGNELPLRRALGRGDVEPLLDMTDISERI